MTKKVNKSNDPRRAAHDDQDLAVVVARRIVALRKGQGLSFDALARRAGLSKGTLVQIEQERANPSIATLCRLAAALGVSVADLVAPSGTAGTLVKRVGTQDVRRLWSGPHGGSADLLAGTAGPDMLEIWRWELKPQERFEASSHARGTRELIHVTSGSLHIEVEGDGVIVRAGESAIALTGRPHAYANPGRSAVRFFMTVHEPLGTA